VKVSVVMAFADRQHVMILDVSDTCSARSAVDMAVANGLDVQHDAFSVNDAPLGVFGERVADDTTLVANDRVEIYRPLQQDPMDLRRQRAALESGRLSKRRK